MSVEESIVAALKASPSLAVVKAYPEAAPASPVAPYIIYTQFAGARVNSFQGDSGLTNPRFQFDVYAKTKAESISLRNAIRVALVAAPELGAVFLDDGSGYEPDTKLHRHRQDFSFWYQE